MGFIKFEVQYIITERFYCCYERFITCIKCSGCSLCNELDVVMALIVYFWDIVEFTKDGVIRQGN